MFMNSYHCIGMNRELLADCHALAVSQGAPRGGGSPLRPDFPVWGEAREGNAMPSRPRSLQEGRNEDLSQRFHCMAAMKPDLHASKSPEGQFLRMQGCREERQPRNENIATRGDGTRIQEDTRPCTTMCARALRPLAHPAARSHAQSMRAASTAGTRRSPHAVA